MINGKMPFDLDAETIFTSLDETIIVADLNYCVCWMNPKAMQTMDEISPLYGIPDAQAMFGKSMDFFHENVQKGREVMKHLATTHRVKIDIKNTYIAETVITPLYDRQGRKCGYLLMLLDITDQAKADRKKDELIEQLSFPILNIWDNIYAIPFMGDLNGFRSSLFIETAMHIAVDKQADYFLFDMSGVSSVTKEGIETVYQTIKGLLLLGTDCYIVGISPDMAMALSSFDFEGKTYKSVKAALHAIKAEEHRNG